MYEALGTWVLWIENNGKLVFVIFFGLLMLLLYVGVYQQKDGDINN